VFQKFPGDILNTTKNPGFNFYYYNIEEARSFISLHFPTSILQVFENSTIDNQFELWKFCSLYHYGGIYLENGYRFINENGGLIDIINGGECYASDDSSSPLLVLNNKNKILHRAIYNFNGLLDYNKRLGIKLDIDNNKTIPLNIFQTWYTKDLPLAMKESVELLKSQNPEFTYQLFDDNDCREFIAANFDCCVLDAFDRLIPGAYKADLWRYCVLYIHGGIYLDIKYHCSNGFKLIELTDKEYFVRDRCLYFPNKKGVYQAFLVCHSGNKILHNCIYDIVKNVRDHYYGPNDLYPTGPGLMGNNFSIQEINSFLLNFDRKDDNLFILKNNNIILKSYPSYYSVDRNVSLSYGKLWESNNIYLKLENGFPKKIHLTCKDKNNITNEIWLSCLGKYKDMYGSDYEIIVHDNNDIYNIIGSHFPNHLDKIKQIKVGAILADIFRYLILYLEGGIYSDMDCEPLIKIDKLLCEKTIGPNIKTILCYEFHKQWHSGLKILTSDKWTYKNVGVCQWFIISSPDQELFLNCYKNCMENIDKLIAIDPSSDNYHNDVITLSGPLGFTKEVVDNLNNDICILPSEYFCSGSGGNGIVPLTDKSYVKHHFTYSWNNLA
jgi:mannosyltransferase OCH1-like enzyme